MIDVNEKLISSLLALNENDCLGSVPFYERDEEYPYRVIASVTVTSLLKAIEAREAAVSYRDFKVGAAAVGYNPHNFRLSILTGANYKIDDTDLINIHAEDIALGKAKKIGCEVVPLLVVVGETQEDHASGLTTDTLHPCGRCRNMLGESALINSRTIIISATPNLQMIEFYSLDGLNGLHKANDGNGIEGFTLPVFEDTKDPYSETEWDANMDHQVLIALSEKVRRTTPKSKQEIFKTNKPTIRPQVPGHKVIS